MKYSMLQKVLHGFSALTIIWLLISGFYVGLISENLALKVFVGELNVSVSLLLAPVFLLRLYVSFGRGYGALAGEKSLTPWLAFFVHTMMYVSVVVVLMSGVLMMDRPIIFFNVVTFSQPFNSMDVTGLFGRIHTPACVLLAALITLHVAAVIKHQLSGQSVIKRMFC